MINITEHQWYDSDIEGIAIDDEGYLDIHSICEVNRFDKSDAMAIASYFNLIQDSDRIVVLRRGDKL